MSGDEDLDGILTLEGPLLEMVYAALCVARGEVVAPRYETLGVFHDILLRTETGYVVGECLGEPNVSETKLGVFRDSVLRLNERLLAAQDKPVREARLVSLTSPEEWTPATQETFLRLREELSRAAIVLTFVGPKKIVYDAVSSSILGLGLRENNIFFVGPGEWAVRYDPATSRYQVGGSSIDFLQFRKLPQSIMPREYWSASYRPIFEEYANFTGSPLPEWFSWEVPDRIGVTWKSVAQVKRAIMHSFLNEGRTLVYDDPVGFVTRRDFGKNAYYTVNLVYHKPIIDRSDAVRIEKEVARLVDAAKANGLIQEELDVYSRLFTDTVTFAYSYWTRSKYRSYHGKIAYTEIHRGEEVLMEALNSGTLGLKLLHGRLTLSTDEGPNTLKIVQGGLHWESADRARYPAVAGS